jgi:hypothetical protein
MSHNKKLIPLWREEAAFARKHGVTMICLEMHPGDAVFNPEKLLQLRSDTCTSRTRL